MGVAVDLCRAIAVAVLGPSGRVYFNIYEAPASYDAMRQGNDEVAFLTGGEIAEQNLAGLIMPGPAVVVNARAPFQPAPTHMPIEAISSSACTIAKRLRPVSGSTRYFMQYFWNASANDDDGVIGYQAQTVAPP